MAPCGWEVGTCGCGSCWDNYKPAQQDRAETLAAHIMWAATGRRYGLCSVVYQPTREPGDDRTYRTYPVDLAGGSGGYSDGTGLAYPAIVDGEWHNLPGGAGCCSATGCEVLLDGPTTKARITAVTIDGAVLNPSAYVLYDGHRLARVDGSCWPACTRHDTAVAGFTVAYTRGTPIPPAVQAAFEILACETAKACAGADCRLPRQLTRLSRQGVDLEVEQIPALELGTRIRTGIKEVDDVIAADNPNALTQRPLVMSPDLPAARMRT